MYVLKKTNLACYIVIKIIKNKNITILNKQIMKMFCKCWIVENTNYFNYNRNES